MNSYAEFLAQKTQLYGEFGFDPIFLPQSLFDFQRHLCEWSLRKGRSAIFADCGLGKTLMQLTWAENVVRHNAKPALILTPLAVSHQTVSEAAKFGIDAARCQDGKHDGTSRILVTNYERLHYFNPDDFAGCVCDESSILKNFDGAIKTAITEFMRRMKYRLLCTATAAPNDWVELGTSSEALGDLGYMDMLATFFKANNGSLHPFHTGHPRGIVGDKFRFRGHAERNFWRWVCSWARAIRKPSDLGFLDGDFELPPLTTEQHIVKSSKPNPDFLFDMPAVGLAEERAERRRSLADRCEKAAALVSGTSRPFISWCSLNDEGDLLEEMLPDAVQVSGSNSDEEKEEGFRAFESGQARGLISKGSVAGFGLNFQHCAHQTCFPSHSFEQYYQQVRRSWRFGQKHPVHIDVVTSEGEARVLSNLQRKSKAAEQMFSRLVEMMNSEMKINRMDCFTEPEKIPSWIC